MSQVDVPHSGLLWDPSEWDRDSCYLASPTGVLPTEGWAQSLASETQEKLRFHDLTQTGSTTPSLWSQGSVCFCWQLHLANSNSSSRHLVPSSGLLGHCTHMLQTYM